MIPSLSRVAPSFPPPPRSPPSLPSCEWPRNLPMPSPRARTLPVTIPRPSVRPGCRTSRLRFEASASRNCAAVITSGRVSLSGALLISTSSSTTRGLNLITSSCLFGAVSIFFFIAFRASSSLGSYSFFVSGGFGLSRRFLGASASLTSSTAKASACSSTNRFIGRKR